MPLGLMHVHELLDAEVSELAGERYVRKSETVQGRRHGTNPGTVKLAGQRVPIRVPRVRGRDGEIPLSSYESLSHRGEVDELLLRRVLYGISCRNYESAAELVPGAIGLSSSSVLRRRRSAWTPVLAAIVLGCDEVAVPTQQRSGCGNGRNLGQHLAAQSLSLDGEPAPVVVREPETLAPKPGSEHTVLLSQVINHILLLAVDPASQNEQ